MNVAVKRNIGYDNNKIEDAVLLVSSLGKLNECGNMFSIFTLYSLLNEGEDFLDTFKMEISEIVLLLAVNNEYILNNFNPNETIKSFKSKLNRSLYVQHKYRTILELSKEPNLALIHKAITLVGEEKYSDVLTALSVMFKVDTTDSLGSIDAQDVFSDSNTAKTLLTREDIEAFN